MNTVLTVFKWLFYGMLAAIAVSILIPLLIIGATVVTTLLSVIGVAICAIVVIAVVALFIKELCEGN
ncbi:MAG: hypothetical protein EP328_00050 [Gammaproteobacteria bacterium]|nr:MAG: hypothetical protein EP328_00050 [Gammaproteobacteria bacterium]